MGWGIILYLIGILLLKCGINETTPAANEPSAVQCGRFPEGGIHQAWK